LLAY